MGLADPVLAQTVKAYVDRNPIMADETVQLIVETDQTSSEESPDWRVLDENFDVLGTTQSQQTTIINMRKMSRVQWIATLAPRRTGLLGIPPIHVGAHQSDPIQLTVKEANRTGETDDNRQIYLEAEVDSHTPNLQGQILLTLRLVSAVSVREGQLDEPEIEWGIVERVGKDALYESTRDGRRYHITERRYMITPQKSGTHVIPPVLFSGKVQDERTRGSLFEDLFGYSTGALGRDPFQTSRSVHRRSPKITLTVKDLPTDLNGRFWLPAKELTLSETWSGDSEQLRMGDSLTRTVVIRAKGQRGEQLPELSLPTPDAVKIYPDKAKTQTDFDGTWVLGTREEKHVLVPTHPGTVTLPPIRVPWWHIETEQWEEARLPSRTLTVLGQPVTSEQISPSETVSSESPLDMERKEMATSTQAMKPRSESEEFIPWQWLTGIALTLWLVTLAAWRRDRQRRNGPGSEMVRKENEKLVSERKAIQVVKSACLEQSAVKTRTALLQWASIKQNGRPCRNLGEVAHILTQPASDHAEISTAIWNLDRTLYATSACQQEWDGRRFWETVKPAITAKPTKSQQQENVLPPLYLH